MFGSAFKRQSFDDLFVTLDRSVQSGQFEPALRALSPIINALNNPENCERLLRQFGEIEEKITNSSLPEYQLIYSALVAKACKVAVRLDSRFDKIKQVFITLSRADSQSDNARLTEISSELKRLAPELIQGGRGGALDVKDPAGSGDVMTTESFG